MQLLRRAVFHGFLCFLYRAKCFGIFWAFRAFAACFLRENYQISHLTNRLIQTVEWKSFPQIVENHLTILSETLPQR